MPSARRPQAGDTVSSTRPASVFLTGFMGAGKTSVGRRLARRLGWAFTDLDACIEEREGRTLAKIFHNSGEAGFRRAEASALRDLLRRMKRSPRRVVALGGGTLTLVGNVQRLKRAQGALIFLEAPIAVLLRRARNQGRRVRRPLLDRQSDAQMKRLLQARSPRYRSAHCTIRTAGKDVHEVAAEIAGWLKKRKSQT